MVAISKWRTRWKIVPTLVTRIITVSYTHLDVYKRQVVLFVKFMLFLINLSKCLAILCAGACVLFISGLMGILGLCNSVVHLV